MPKTANNLSEAFLRVRKYLWDGTGYFVNAYPKQESCICFAAMLAERTNAITPEQRNKIESIVQSRLGNYLLVPHYVIGVHGAIKPSEQAIQDYRHAWLIELSKEFADETTHP